MEKSAHSQVLYFLVHDIYLTAMAASYFEDSDFTHITYLLLKYDDLFDETTCKARRRQEEKKQENS